MGMWVGRGRKARVAYGFDDIALVPGTVAINPNEVDVAWELCGRRIELPIIAAAMDGVTDPRFAIEMGRHDTCGADLVNHCVNDILVQGARPLFFLDYVATGKVEPGLVESVIEGIARACRENGTALLGG